MEFVQEVQNFVKEWKYASKTMISKEFKISVLESEEIMKKVLNCPDFLPAYSIFTNNCIKLVKESVHHNTCKIYALYHRTYQFNASGIESEYREKYFENKNIRHHRSCGADEYKMLIDDPQNNNSDDIVSNRKIYRTRKADKGKAKTDKSRENSLEKILKDDTYTKEETENNASKITGFLKRKNEFEGGTEKRFKPTSNQETKQPKLTNFFIKK